MFSRHQLIPPIFSSPKQIHQIRYKPKYWTKKHNAFSNYSEAQFFNSFRVDRSTFLYIEELLLAKYPNCFNTHGPGRKKIDLRTKLLITMNYLGTGAAENTLAAVHGHSQASISRILTEMVHKISMLSKDWIKLPTDEERKVSQAHFKTVANFPQVWALMDGTHIQVQVKKYGQDRYFSRKGDTTINVQATIDHKCRFIDIDAGWPGSVQDSRVFNSSNLYSMCRNVPGFILADKGYPCKKFLLTPLKKPRSRQFTSAELKYNNSHGKTRSLIERTFGRWKRKFIVLTKTARIDANVPPW